MGTRFRIVVPAASAVLMAGLVIIVQPGDAGARLNAMPWFAPDPSAAQPNVVSQRSDSPDSSGDADAARVVGGPMDVFADIERGWNSRNVDMILRHFGTQKVAISVDGTGPSGGSFSRNQSYYLLKDLFRYTITRKFEFTQYRKPGEDGGQSFAIAERQYQKTDDGRLFKDKVYVSLHLEQADDGDHWVVDEIKSIR
jgi:hypothetical protein